MIAFIGDVHGDFKGLAGLMLNHPEVDQWVQAGDFGGRDISYEELPAPISFISGNHENWNELVTIDSGKGPRNLKHIKTGTIEVIDGNTVIGFGGNYSPKYYEFTKDDLQQERRRHFTRSEYDKSCGIGKNLTIDFLITHEAPSPYISVRGDSDRDLGMPVITELIEEIKPGIHIFGHHHKFTTSRRGSTLSIGLGYWNHGILFFDTESSVLTYLDASTNIKTEIK